MILQHGRVTKKRVVGALIITSLIDVFTILVVFLIRNYSADGSLATAANLTLPYSNSTDESKEVVLSVAITGDMIMVDDKPVVPCSEASAIRGGGYDQVIAKLQSVFEAKRSVEEEMVRRGILNSTTGKCVLQIDKEVPFDLVYKVMNTAGTAGYTNVKLAVQKEET